MQPPSVDSPMTTTLSPSLSLDTPESKRAHEQLLRYWNNLKGLRPYPSEDEVDPDAIDAIWDCCFLVTLIDQPGSEGLQFEYVGQQLLAAYGVDMTGMSPEDHDAPQLSSMLDSIHQVVNTAQPVIDDSVFVNRRNLEVRYRCALLPLGDDKGVNYVLGCMRWKFC